MAKGRHVSELKNIHRGMDFHVIGAAASMDYFDPAFFRDRLTVCVNTTYKRFPGNYIVGKELPQSVFDEVRDKLIVSEFQYGYLNSKRCDYTGEGHYYYFTHKHNHHTIVDWNVLGTDDIVVSYSTITSAMHLAAYMGARNILLSGVDGGMLDGRLCYDGYYADGKLGNGDWYRGFIRDMLTQTRELRNLLWKVYGCRVYHLSPFLDFSLEGHQFTP